MARRFPDGRMGMDRRCDRSEREGMERPSQRGILRRTALLAAAALAAVATGCRSPEAHRADADRVALGLIDGRRAGLQSNSPPFFIERPSDVLRRRLLEIQGLPTSFARAVTNRPAAAEPSAVVPPMTLGQALKVAVGNAREYQEAKETVFGSALDLDLQSDAFRSTFAGLVSAAYSDDRSGETATRAVGGSFEPGVTRKLPSGAEIGATLALDVAKLLTGEEGSAFGVLADLSLTVPLLRRSARDIVTEPLTQAERNLVYAIHRFERYKRTFAVDISRSFYGVLEQIRRVKNQEENLRGLALATRRAEELGKAGRTSEVQVNLARQNELTARDRLTVAKEAVTERLDRFKILLGLPPDAQIELDGQELSMLPSPAAAAPMTEEDALREALVRRLDLRIAHGAVEDARRKARVAGDALRAGMDLKVSGAAGGRRAPTSAAQDDVELRVDRGSYRAALGLQLPWERTAERNAYRESLLALDAAVRACEAAEDTVKSDVRATYRSLRQARETCAIQEQAMALAERRVQSTEMLLEAGRAGMRDVVEARDSQLLAQNAVMSARVAYRLAEMDLWRTAEMLQVTEDGVMGDVHVARP